MPKTQIRMHCASTKAAEGDGIFENKEKGEKEGEGIEGEKQKTTDPGARGRRRALMIPTTKLPLKKFCSRLAIKICGGGTDRREEK